MFYSAKIAFSPSSNSISIYFCSNILACYRSWPDSDQNYASSEKNYGSSYALCRTELACSFLSERDLFNIRIWSGDRWSSTWIIEAGCTCNGELSTEQNHQRSIVPLKSSLWSIEKQKLAWRILVDLFIASSC